MRIVERLYFGDSLFLLVKAYGDLSEVEHLSMVLDRSKNSTDYQFYKSARVSLRSRLILLDTGHISAPDLSSHSFLSGNLWGEVRKLLRKKHANRYYKIIPMPYPEYYYHFLIDDVPSLIQTQLRNPEYKALFHGEIPSFAIQIMNSFQISYELSKNSIVQVENLLVPRKKLNYMAEFRREINRRITFTSADDIESYPKIFIGRQNLARSDSQSEQKILESLIAQGFKEIDPGALSFEKQVLIFAQAKTIVALHGGALSNIIFCKPGTTVIEIFNHEYRTYPFQKISLELGLDYRSIEGLNSNHLIENLQKELG